MAKAKKKTSKKVSKKSPRKPPGKPHRITLSSFTRAAEGSFGILSTIADRLGVSRPTVYKFTATHPEKTAEILKAESERTLDHVETKLYDSINEGDVGSVKWYLSRKGASRGYSEKVETRNDISGSITLSVNGGKRT